MRKLNEAQKDLIRSVGGNEDDIAAWEGDEADFDWEALNELAD